MANQKYDDMLSGKLLSPIVHSLETEEKMNSRVQAKVWKKKKSRIFIQKGGNLKKVCKSLSTISAGTST